MHVDHLDIVWNARLPSSRGKRYAIIVLRITDVGRQIVSQQRYNKSMDWYALGVLIFEMLSGLRLTICDVP